MRRRRSDSGMSLDSLLDTITNVVGFLVIVLAVLQLNVTWSSRPGPPSPGTPAPPKSRPSAAAGLRVRLEEMAMKIKDAENEVAGRPSEPALDREKESLDKLLAKLEVEIAALEKKVKEARVRLAGIQRKIANPPPKPPPQATEVVSARVVDVYTGGGTEPGWRKKSRMDFYCRRGRIYPFLNEGVINKCLKKVAEGALGGRTAIRGPADVNKLIAYCQTHDIGDAYFRLLFRQGKGFMLVCRPRSDRQGEAVGQIAAATSDYAKYLRQRCDPRKTWVKFFVFADSFEVYLAARAKAESAGLQAGWKPLKKDFEFEEPIGGGGGGPPNVGPDG